MSISVMPAPGRCQSPGITERVDSHGLITFGVEGEARLLHNSPFCAPQQLDAEISACRTEQRVFSGFRLG
jgi:hypothetical protein